jgi:hypothetical protein
MYQNSKFSEEIFILNNLEIQHLQVKVHDMKRINKKIVSMVVPITIENPLQMVRR